jgi:hypothetical protein
MASPSTFIRIFAFSYLLQWRIQGGAKGADAPRSARKNGPKWPENGPETGGRPLADGLTPRQMGLWIRHCIKQFPVIRCIEEQDSAEALNMPDP